ncbi:MAG: SOS response-associated peptidase [Lachnospiraceae bacterium]|nr:SOS response-associated peptidase [Lachnospiraceae bacterium]
MCGTYFIYDEVMAEAERIFDEITSAMPRVAAGDIRPSMTAPAVTGTEQVPEWALLTWGFTGFDKSRLIINARAESIREKPMFRESIQKRRCVLPAAGFYEWDSRKQKAVFTRPGEDIIFLGGIWRPEKDGARFVIITREANESMLPVHDRMPLILDPDEAKAWLKRDDLTDDLLKMPMPELSFTREYEQLGLL